jgi:MFS family permease
VLSLTAVTVVVFVGGIIGSELASCPALATLPISLMVVGVALFTIPASFFMKRFGRKSGFQSAAMMASLASLLAAAAIALHNFPLFSLSMLFVGGHSSFVQQYRFAAAESVPSRLESRAVSIVLLGIGWNFLFVGGTVMLSQHYYPPERFKAQAFNDFSIFGIQALASFSAGSLIYLTSWNFMNLLVLPLLALMLLSLVYIARRSPPVTVSSPS